MAEGDDEVGYGKPPKSSQFKPGTSGNPDGRRKRPFTYQELVEKVLNEKVSVNGENGKKIRMTRGEVTIRNLSTKAMQGNIPAWMALNATRGFGQIKSEEFNPEALHVFTLLMEEDDPGPHSSTERRKPPRN